MRFFSAERYGASGDGATVVYDSDPSRPIGRWKVAWESAKIRAAVSCRFHDLRHTGCTRMLEAGICGSNDHGMERVDNSANI
jgi:integrase